VRADLLAIAAQNVERLKPMPAFPARFAKYAILLWKIPSMRLLRSLSEGQALDIGAKAQKMAEGVCPPPSTATYLIDNRCD